MLTSMTGFGQSEVEDRDLRVAVEIRSVNHRFLDVSVKLPRGLAGLEKEIRELVKERISRGRISVAVEVGGGAATDVSVNLPLMERYLDILREFARKHGLSDEVDINTLALLPEVFVKEEDGMDSEKWRPLVRKAVEDALEGCMAMKLEEGRALEADMKARVDSLERIVARVEKMAPDVVEANRKSFRERAEKLVEGVQLDRDRWMTELAILADRLDFTEELTRLKSHLAQFRSCLEAGGVVSKKLTYLLQEIHREGTTLATKASDAGIAEEIVQLKEEVEKLREQVQNVE